MVRATLFVKDISWFTLSTITRMLQAIILLPLLTKYLGTTNYGIWSQVSLTITLFTPFALLGLDGALVRFTTGTASGVRREQRWSTAAVGIFLLSLLVAVGLWLAAPYLAEILTQVEEATRYFRLVGALVALSALESVFKAAAKAEMKLNVVSIASVLFSVSFLLLAAVLLITGYGLIGVLLAYGAAKLISIAYSAYHSGLLGRLRLPTRRAADELFSYGFPLTFIPILNWAFQVGDQYILGAYHGAAMVGVYAVGFSLANVLRTLPTPILSVLDSYATQAYNEGDKESLREYFAYSYKLVFMLLIPATAGLILLAKPIVLIMTTKDFVSAATLIPMLAVGVALFTFSHIANTYLRLLKRTDIIRNFFAILTALNLALNFWLIPIYDVRGAAIATLVTFLVGAAYAVSVLVRNGIDLQPRFILKSFISTGIMLLVVDSLRGLVETPMAKILLVIPISAVAYFICVWLLRGFSEREIAFVKRLMSDYF